MASFTEWAIGFAVMPAPLQLPAARRLNAASTNDASMDRAAATFSAMAWPMTIAAWVHL